MRHWKLIIMLQSLRVRISRLGLLVSRSKMTREEEVHHSMVINEGIKRTSVKTMLYY